MDINLNTLKLEIEEYLETTDFAVFRGTPGGLEDSPIVLWDSERYPDYQLFLESARRVGAGLVVFATREFEAVEIDETLEQVGECDMERAERREMESRLRDLRAHIGATCSLELGFDHQGRMYVYELTPGWYDEFLDIREEIVTLLPSGDDDEDGESLNGYFSRN